MAALGAIGVGNNLYKNQGSMWTSSYSTGPCKYKFDVQLPEGIIYGTAQVAGIAAPYHKVMLIDRITRTLVRTTYTDGNGSFRFTGLGTDSQRYMALIQDDGEPASYNARPVDKVTAVDINL